MGVISLSRPCGAAFCLGHISVAVPVDQDVIARLMTCEQTIELLEAAFLHELQKNARELLLKEAS